MYKVTNIEDMTGSEIYNAIDDIKRNYLLQNFDLVTARSAVQVLLDEVNKRGLKIAKKHGKRYNKVTVIQVLR